jgi:hypothetical protein
MTDDPDFAESIDSIGSRWKEEVARAKEWKPGMMRSAWTMPLERLVNEREHVIRQLGKDPGEMKVPKSMRPDKLEKVLPEHVRGLYRRGVYLHGRMATAHEQHLKRRRG